MRMFHMARHAIAAQLIGLVAVSLAIAQQQLPSRQLQPQQQPLPQQLPVQPAVVPQVPAVPVAPEGFVLNALQQAQLDQVLSAWQTESAKVTTFKCSFERWEYDVAFGPANQDIPLNKNRGELSYQQPDKGSFQITEIRTFQAQPIPPGTQPPAQLKGDWITKPDAIGEHYVCDGKSVYEYRPDQKQLVERPIPPQLQGKAIVDGPLPFLFGAEAAKMKARYWLRIDQQQNQDPNQIWIIALPKFQQQAADFSEIRVILDRQRLLPAYMQVQMPNRSRHVYIFDLKNASINNPLARLQALFARPRVPSGWQLVVENVPVAEAPQPQKPAPR
jgi:TIGR03009 family protein